MANQPAQGAFPKDQNNQPIPALQQVGANSSILLSPSGANVQSAAINARIIRIAVSAAMNIEFGSNPTATTSSLWMPANSVEYFSFIPNQLVGALGTGAVTITPMN